MWLVSVHMPEMNCVLVAVCACVALLGAGAAACVPPAGALARLLPPLPPLPPILSTVADAVKNLLAPLCLKEEPERLESVAGECAVRGRALGAASAARAAALVGAGRDLASFPPAVRDFLTSHHPPALAQALAHGRAFLHATSLLQQEMTKRYGIDGETFQWVLHKHNVSIPAEQCVPEEEPACPAAAAAAARYRTYDGSCNNRHHPAWGQANTRYGRLAKHNYADGVWAVRGARSGRALPAPRELSARLFPERGWLSAERNYFNLQWAQFITHDLANRVFDTTELGGIQCCAEGGRGFLPQQQLADSCLPIAVSELDPFYSRFGVRCLPYTRSSPAPPEHCRFQPAEQINGVSSYLDGSMIYGNSGAECAALRGGAGGQLRVSAGDLLPLQATKHCANANHSQPCYLTGDVRVNQLPPLVALHTLWLREHNRVARELARAQPHWSDERLFQEARRIVIAQLQHITYYEWVPLNLGEGYTHHFLGGQAGVYRADTSAAVLACFAGAAFRAPHAALPAHFALCPDDNYVPQYHRLSEHYANPSLVSSAESLDALLRGMVAGPAGGEGPQATAEVRERLFASRGGWGLDLLAIDIQRGRDHGLATYNDIRELCGLRRAHSFADLANEIPPDRLSVLASVYESVEDVDLMVGGVSELPLPGAAFGPTLQCLVAEQLYRTRSADRYFYDLPNMEHSFTPGQLQALRRTSLARVICDNSGVGRVPRAALRPPSAHNPPQPCAALPTLDLGPWTQQP